MDKSFYYLLKCFSSTELRYQMKNVNLHNFFFTFFQFYCLHMFQIQRKTNFQKSKPCVFFGFLWCPSLMSSPELCTGEDINLGHSPVQ